MYDVDGALVASDTGLWLNSMDFGGIREPLQYAAQQHPSIAAMVSEGKFSSTLGATYPFASEAQAQADNPPIYANLPWIFPIVHMFGKHAYLPVSGALNPPSTEVRATLLEEEALTSGRRLRLLFEGCNRMIITFDASDGEVQRWSLTEELTPPTA
eukprot:gene12943-15299_t